MTTKENGKKSMIQQAFIDLAEKLEQECENWQQEPVPPELHDRILEKIAELDEKNEQV